MARYRMDRKIVMRYAAFQLAGVIVFVLVLLAVRYFFYDLSLRMFLLLTFLWVLKDVLLYPLVWRAYDWEAGGKELSMVGMTGTAQGSLDPEGYVFVRGELWKAMLEPGSECVEQGGGIRVKGKRGLLLLVEPYRDL